MRNDVNACRSLNRPFRSEDALQSGMPLADTGWHPAAVTSSSFRCHSSSTVTVVLCSIICSVYGRRVLL